MNVNEFLRKNGNINNEIKIKIPSEEIKILGNPKSPKEINE